MTFHQNILEEDATFSHSSLLLPVFQLEILSYVHVMLFIGNVMPYLFYKSFFYLKKKKKRIDKKNCQELHKNLKSCQKYKFYFPATKQGSGFRKKNREKKKQSRAQDYLLKLLSLPSHCLRKMNRFLFRMSRFGLNLLLLKLKIESIIVK